ncbi:DUF2627 family protein [Lentibacillus cibarius]|uniref:DUF2627 domain-containing protein n=1 Tax=Lentibacillus cibarius TaxID=2583219 RepID=A0A5S3QFU8_9BACI|nr:DUF2627 family protein [Lentibacillus cibarius]TMN20762.1 DUF2627 domain-containing protein [Lentibacillus cibarius]
MARFIAVLLLLLPGLLSALGIKLMRDTLFNEFSPIFVHAGIQFAAGFLFFLAGLAFIGGFIVRRDRKNLKKKKENGKRKRK